MEPELIGRLIDGHAAALELYARQWCDAPEDVVQEAFVVLSRLPRPPENPAAWLFRAVRNGAINAATAARRRRRYESAAASGSAGWFEAGPTRSRPGEIDPESAAEALGALPIAQREVIVAHLWGGLTFEQVAGLAGCSPSAAHRLYHTGLSALRERLGVPCPRNTSRQIPS
jgi:RNA polymerase sigma-70 factor (ECF subfamily)